jgi:spermidine synthase
VDVNVKFEIILAGDLFAEQFLAAHFFEGSFEVFSDIGVFSSQVDDTFFRANGVPGENHAGNKLIGIISEQQAVFKGARFAFVSVADDELAVALSCCSQVPFYGRRKAGAATTLES